MRHDDDTLHMLLAGEKLSGAQREQILGDVLAQRAKPPFARIAAWSAAVLVPAAAALVLFLVVRNPHVDGSSSGDALTGKGASGAVLRARCADRPEARCVRGDKLIFEVDGDAEGGLLASYADGPAGRIWYFPSADGHLASVPAAPGLKIVRELARIGDEHRPGRYTLHILLLERPATQREIVAGAARARASASLPLEVEP